MRLFWKKAVIGCFKFVFRYSQVRTVIWHIFEPSTEQHLWCLMSCFVPRSCDRISRLKVFALILSPSRQMPGQCLKLGRDCVRLHPFRFILFNHWYIFLKSLNKPNTRRIRYLQIGTRTRYRWAPRHFLISWETPTRRRHVTISMKLAYWTANRRIVR
jgi:hypothetical protein